MSNRAPHFGGTTTSADGFMHKQAEMNLCHPDLCPLFRARPPLEYMKPQQKSRYHKRPIQPMVDPFLPPLAELFENPAPESKVNVKQEIEGQADEEMK